jgi:hypothetical protein
VNGALQLQGSFQLAAALVAQVGVEHFGTPLPALSVAGQQQFDDQIQLDVEAAEGHQELVASDHSRQQRNTAPELFDLGQQACAEGSLDWAHAAVRRRRSSTNRPDPTTRRPFLPPAGAARRAARNSTRRPAAVKAWIIWPSNIHLKSTRGAKVSSQL